MKVVAYSIKPFEKEFLARANQKKHDITLISNSLALDTVGYAEGKDAVMVFTNDDVSSPVIEKLADLGIRYIATRSVGIDHIDTDAAQIRNIKLANVPSYSPQAIAEHTIALALALSRNLCIANEHSRRFDFRLNDLIGFNFSGKTVGLIGLGQIGMATAAIFSGFGCKVIGHDVNPPSELNGVKLIGMHELLAESDIISIHVPLTKENKYMIGRASIALMKNGVMLLNTSRGGIISTEDVLVAVRSGKIGYLGLDVYEHERNQFFQDHENDGNKDLLLKSLLELPNVLVTPHQAFLTKEALQEIANQTIRNLDFWQEEKCVGDNCICKNHCRLKNAKAKSAIQDHINYLP